MGKTYRQMSAKYEDDKQYGRKNKHQYHANNRKPGGMKIINSPLVDEDDYLEDEVQIVDHIVINKNSEDDN